MQTNTAGAGSSGVAKALSLGARRPSLESYESLKERAEDVEETAPMLNAYISNLLSPTS
jgi:hypothetical protein